MTSAMQSVDALIVLSLSARDEIPVPSDEYLELLDAMEALLGWPET